MKTTIIVLAVVIVAVLGFYLFRSNNNTALTPTESPSVSMMASASQSPDLSPSPSISPATPASPTPVSKVDSFTVSAANFSYSLKNITVNKGDTVKINFQNTEGNHDFVIDEFNVKTAIIGAGQSAAVQFVADKTGSFQYYCSVGSHRALGMWGTLTVK